MAASLGSLCTGYGGLDMAVAQVLDVEPAWVADPDRPPLEGAGLRRAVAERCDLAEDADSPARGERRLPAPGQAESGRARPDAGRRGGASVAHPASDGRGEGRPEPARLLRGPDAPLGGHATEWGDYGPAIRRWEHVLGRPAPRPVEPGRTGDRLNPAFVEWLMGLPDGWVTAVPGLTRNQQLHALGNGVVPQQGAEAIAHLLNRIEVAA